MTNNRSNEHLTSRKKLTTWN